MGNMQKRILILGAGQNQLTAIKEAKKRGLYVISIDPNRGAPGFVYSDEFLLADLTSTSACIQFARNRRIDAVLTVASEIALPLSAAITETLQLPGISGAVVERATNKHLMRQCFESLRVPSPSSYLAESCESGFKILSDIIVAVVKPALSHGGRGITKLDISEGREVFSNAYERAKQFSRNGFVLVEEFARGQEYSVEAVTVAGLTKIVANTRKMTTGSPYYVEIGHTQPAEISISTKKAVQAIVEKAIESVGLDNSPSHTEIKIEGDDIRVIELGARLGGGFISSHLVPLSTGVDLVGASIDLSLGNTPHLKAKLNNASVVRFFTPDPGKIVEISGIEEVRSSGIVEEACVYLSLGDEVRTLRDSTGRVGHVIVSAANTTSAETILTQALKEIRIVTSAT